MEPLPIIGNHIVLYPIKENKISIYNKSTRKTYVVGEKEASVLFLLDGEKTLDDIAAVCEVYTRDEIEKLIHEYEKIGLFCPVKAKLNIFKIRKGLLNPNRYLNEDQFLTKSLYWITIVGMPFIFCIGLLFHYTNGFGMLSESIIVSDIISRYFDFNIMNWAVMILLSVFSLALHETAHTITARYFNVSVPEIGIMLYFFIPFAYTNLSAIHLLKNRWNKMLILLAGTFTNLGHIGICLLLIHAKSIIVSAYAFGLIIINAGTILLNTIVFLKFDGYYILEIILNEPNLKENANNHFKMYLVCLLNKDRNMLHDFWNHWKKDENVFITHLGYLVYVIFSTIYIPVFTINLLLSVLHGS